MIIPLSADLRLGRMPWVTWAVILLCIIVFAFQFQSNAKFNVSLGLYCQYANSQASQYPGDLIRNNPDACYGLLYERHLLSERGHDMDELDDQYRERFDDASSALIDKMIGDIHRHYDSFSKIAPELLDEKLMYYPDSYNPLTMITSSLAHGGWLHIIFNLVFFFAFAPAVELIIGSMVRYTLALVAIAVACSLSYSVFSLGGDNTPTLGLSGVVMGVIGLSAFLMPRARINTVIWLIVPIMWIPIPAWFLAAWFVGWDAWDLLSDGMNNGINLVAHVSGGVAGYLIGRWFFKARKEEIQEELDEEIYQMSAHRSAGFSVGNTASLYKDTKALEKLQQADQQRKEEGAYYDKLYNLVRTGQDSAAVNLLLADVDPLRLYPDEFDSIFEKIGHWNKQRAYLCIGRLLIDLYLRKRLYADAFRVLKACLEVTREFVLADPHHVLLLAHEANRQKLYKYAVALLHNAEQRYTEEVNYLQCGLLEVDILSTHLKAVPLARQRLMQLKQFASPADQHSLDQLASHLG